ncbi:MAG: hypothetical protein GVY30_02300 [Chloroflexi bacterium]|nr:hypothetical protein [Chloroflexota bacterium]
MKGKEKERAILNLVYSTDQYEELVDSECPDFHIRKKGQAVEFGVEVTEFYFSESSARVQNIHSYVDELIEEGLYRHRDDKTSLPVCEATVSRDEEPDRRIQCIYQTIPGVDEYTLRIAEAISRKSEKLKSYAQDLTHVNLIIFDTEHRLYKVAEEDFSRYFLTSDIISAIRDTGFREVYFITRLESERWVYIPLKLVFLLSEVYVFDHVLVTYYPDLLHDIASQITLFAQHLKRHQMGEIYIRGRGNESEVIWSGYGLCITNCKHFKQPRIRDYTDLPLPNDSYPVALEIDSPVAENKFKERLNSFLDHHVFICGVVCDVEEDANEIWGYSSA